MPWHACPFALATRSFVSAIGLILLSYSTAYAVQREAVAIPLKKSAIYGEYYVKSLKGYLFRAKTKEPAPTVIFLHGCGSYRGHVTKRAETYADHFTSLGYSTLVLDTADQRKLGDKACKNQKTNMALLKVRGADLDAATDWLIANKISKPNSIVALGLSHGGQVVVSHDQKGQGSSQLAGGIAFYPGCDVGIPNARYPLLILVGDRDDTGGGGDLLSVACPKYAKHAIGAKVEVLIYPGAGHGFNVVGVAPAKITGQSCLEQISDITPFQQRRAFVTLTPFLRKCSSRLRR